jgi:hypothetical protein
MIDLLGKVRRFFGGGRVLQLEEVRQMVAEHLRLNALTGLTRRYLPDHVTVRVAPQDASYLQPFVRQLRLAVRQEVGRLAREPGWSTTTESPGFSLEIDPSLRPGAAPALMISYPEGTDHAFWSRSVPGPRTEHDRADGRAAARPLRLVITTATQDGTAQQEEVYLALDRELVLGTIGGDPQPGVLVLDEQQRVVRFKDDSAEQRTLAFDLQVRDAAQPPESPQALPPDWNRLWVSLKQPGVTYRVVWCPGGLAILGRSLDTAHVVPEIPAKLLSRAHLALWLDAIGELFVMDLGSTNGTGLGAGRLPEWQPIRFELPATFSVGEDGLVTLEVK